MSISNNFPAIRPSLLLDFARAKVLDPRITFTRASTGTFYDKDGILRTAQNNVARFDHNPVTEESLGLLIEEQRTNLVTYSDDFANAAWTKSGTTITSNTVVAPDGALTGDKIVESATTASHIVAASATVVSGTTYTVTAYFKAAERGFALLSLATSFPTTSIQINLATGAVTTGTGTPLSSSATNVGNGWWRAQLTVAANASGSGVVNIFPSIDGVWANRGYTGDGTSGIFIWGAQLEVGAFPTSYIPTVASQVTRSADAASMTGTNFSSWFNNAEGTMYADLIVGTTASAHIFSVNTNATANRIALRTGTSFDFLIQTNSVTQAQVAALSAVLNASVKVVGTYKTNDVQMAMNNVLSANDSSVVLPVTTQADIGSITNLAYLNGTISKIAYYPFRLPNNQLQALTGS